MGAELGMLGRCKLASANTPTSTAPSSKKKKTKAYRQKALRLIPLLPPPLQNQATDPYPQPRHQQHPSRKHRRPRRVQIIPLQSQVQVTQSARKRRSSKWRASTGSRRAKAMRWCRRRRMMLRVLMSRSEGVWRGCMILYSRALSGIYMEERSARRAKSSVRDIV